MRLSLQKNTAPRVWHKGIRFVRVYSAGALRVTVRYHVTESCEGNPECDGYGMQATISLSAGNETETVDARGGCGC